MSRCRSCPATVTWVTIQSTGGRMPIDAKPSPEGNIRLVGDGIADVLSATAAHDARNAGERLHLSHFATCPNAKRHRRG